MPEASLAALSSPDASTSTKQGTLKEQQVFADQQFSYPDRALAKQFSSNTLHLATFEGLPIHSQDLAPCLDHPQQYQPQLFQFPRLYFVQQARSV